LTPDILDEPTPIVPFSAINITLLSGVVLVSLNFILCLEKLNIYHEVHDLIESAWLPGDSKSVEISPSPAT
jgi:hypothetical protein